LAEGQGVCRAAIAAGKTIVVDDVHQFEGHIACDSRSKSEIVVPVRNRLTEIVGVLDVDSTSLAAFDETDAEWLEKIVNLVH
jgi:GAF domain-containing protein